MTVAVTFRQLIDATALQYRASSRELGIILAFVILFPLGFLFFLSVIVQPALRPQVLVGSIMMEMALLNVNVVAQTIGSDKQSKIYDLWVSLPINPVVYVLANSLSVLPYSLLSAAVTLAIGVAFFGIVLSVPLLLLVAALLLIWASTLGVGFLIGVYGSSPRQINTVAQFVGIVMTFFAPIFYPLSALPLVLQYVSYAWPLTWGALLLHALVVADLSGAALDAVVLAGFTGLWAGLVAVGLRWRQV
jgi:ABC-2 type transport system permease protein